MSPFFKSADVVADVLSRYCNTFGKSFIIIIITNIKTDIYGRYVHAIVTITTFKTWALLQKAYYEELEGFSVLNIVTEYITDRCCYIVCIVWGNRTPLKNCIKHI